MLMMLFFLGCRPSAEDSACEFSGDFDGIGSDTGDLPSLYGGWNTTFGTRSFYDECSIEGLNQNELDWINGGAMEIGGLIDQIQMTFASAPGAEIYGMMSSFGGVTFAGRYTFRGNDLHISLGGLLFDNAQLNVTEIEGHGFLGVDRDGDGSIDCGLSGDFNAKKPN